jgi:hypothetical protein
MPNARRECVEHADERQDDDNKRMHMDAFLGSRPALGFHRFEALSL